MAERIIQKTFRGNKMLEELYKKRNTIIKIKSKKFDTIIHAVKQIEKNIGDEIHWSNIIQQKAKDIKLLRKQLKETNKNIFRVE